jgi:hypothetical protein
LGGGWKIVLHVLKTGNLLIHNTPKFVTNYKIFLKFQEIFTISQRDDKERKNTILLPSKKDMILNPIVAYISTNKTAFQGSVAEPVQKWQQQLDYYNGSYLKMVSLFYLF